MNTPERVIAILDELASAGGPLGVSELGRQLKIGKNNIFRILSALESKGWVEQNTETKKYGLTGAMAGVAFKALSRLDVQNISLPYLEELQSVTGETSALSIRMEMERMFINCIPSSHSLRHYLPIGRRSKLWYGSGGKSILAFMADDEIAVVLSELSNSSDSALPSGQAVNVESLREELARIRKQGLAVGSGERTSGVLGVSAPIFDHKQQVVGCLSVSGPMPRFDMEKALRFSTLIMEKANKISLILGAKVETPHGKQGGIITLPQAGSSVPHSA
jgi:IclR family KDG regulon transcriptional repressor